MRLLLGGFLLASFSVSQADRILASRRAADRLQLLAKPAHGQVAVQQETSLSLSFASPVKTEAGADLRATGVPKGVTAWFYPSHLSRTGNTLFVRADEKAVPGSYALSVETVRNGHVTTSLPIPLRVLPLGTADASQRPFDFQQAAQHQTASPLPALGTLLDNGGHLAWPVSQTTVRQWLHTLDNAKSTRLQAAQAHVWLGEYLLAHDEQPEQARQHFRQAQRLLPVSHPLYGLAAYDSALALYYEGAYGAAKDAFLALLTDKPALHGFDRKTCVLWSRMAISCWGYHEQRLAMGIPEPPKLDPICGAAGLAACIRDLNGAYDKKTVLSACRVTGEGSVMANILAATHRLGYTAHLVTCDEVGLRALPKPLIAYVEHDHYIAVVKADEQGVSYLCSDCGAWPGGRVNLTWKQWRALEASQYVVVRRTDDAWDQAIKYASVQTPEQSGISQLTLASVSSTVSTLAVRRMAAALKGHFKFKKDDAPINGPCGTKQTSPTPPPAACPNVSKDSAGAAGTNGASCQCDPVELAAGEENYGPIGGLTVYNPYGPSVDWSLSYRSLRGCGQFFASYAPSSSYDFTYEDYDFGVGWTQNYNRGVYDPTGGRTGTKYIFTPSGGRISFTMSAVPTAGTPKVRGSVQAGNAMLVEWDYNAATPGGYYVITMRDRTQMVTTGYNSAFGCHLLSKMLDRNGHALNFVYGSPAHTNGWPLLAKITNDAGTALLTIVRAADSTGNITHVDDAYGRSIYYHCGNYPCPGTPYPWPQSYQQVDHISQLVATGTLQAPDHFTYGYQNLRNSENELIPFLHTLSVPSPTGTGTSASTINYRTTALVSSLVDSNGNTRTYTSSDVNGNPQYPSAYTKVAVTDRIGNLSYSYIVSYNSAMEETYRKNGAGQVLATTAYADGNDPYKPSSVTDGNGHTSHYSYDTYGNMTQTTSARGTVTHNTFDYTNFALGELKATQEGGKTPTSFTYYEPSGLPHTISTPAPGLQGGGTVTTTMTYDGLGNPLTVTTPGNNATLVNGVDQGITTTFNYQSDPAFSYSQTARIGQPLTVTDNLGHITHLRYDARGNQITRIDALSNESDSTFNIADQLLTSAAPATGENGVGRAYTLNTYLYPEGPQTFTTAYDESGASIRQVKYGYGAEGETLSTTAVSGGGNTTLASQTYDAMYRVKTVSDGNNHATTYSYNTAGYLSKITYPGSSGAYDTVQYTSYDTLGNVLQRVDGRGIVTNFTYNDPENRLTDVQYPAYATLNIHLAYDGYGRRSGMTDGTGVNSYTYDDGNRPLSTTTTYTGMPTHSIAYNYFADGSRQTMTTPAGTYSYSYDGAQRMASLTNPLSETSSWSYQANNWLRTQTLGNGVTSTYSNDARGLVTNLTTQTSIGRGLSAFSGMAYDGVGNRATLTAAIAGAPTLSGQTHYGYDYKDELVQEQSTRGGSYNNAFVYDSAGNPTTFRGAAFGYNADNQNTAYTHDGNGNPTGYKGTALTFDPENHLTAYGTALTAGYTGDGLRAWKQTPAPRSKTYFLYDGITSVCELDNLGKVKAINTFGANGLLSRRSTTGNIFYTFDPQGNVTQRLDAQGNALNSALFDAYGTGISTGASLSDPFGYNAQWGYYHDTETDLYLLGYRYYDATTGHFLTRDPIGIMGGMNVYGYVGANPITYADPKGEIAFVLVGEGLAEFIAEWWAANSAAASTAATLSTATAVLSSDTTASDSPMCGCSRTQAMIDAYDFAGIPIGGGGNYTPVPWALFRFPAGMSKNSIDWANFKQQYYPEYMGWNSPYGASVEEHPFGHPDQPGPAHHECPHFHATNSNGSQAVFTYTPLSP